MSVWRRKIENETYLEKRERIGLTQAILGELRTQKALRDKILASVGKREKDDSYSRHPVVLLLVGFLLTGGLGTAFSIFWQGREWDRQQDLLAAQRSLEQKYQVANDTASAIGKIQSGMLSVIGALYADHDTKCLADLRRTEPEWQKIKLEWQANAPVLSSRISINFSGTKSEHQVERQFQELVKCYKNLNTGLTNMVESVNANAGKRNDKITEDLPKLTEALNSSVNEGMTSKLMSVMGTEMRRGPEGESSRWDFLSLFWRSRASPVEVSTDEPDSTSTSKQGLPAGPSGRGKSSCGFSIRTY